MRITKTIKLELQKLDQNEEITPDCYHSLDEGKTCFPIQNKDSIGQTPKDFSPDRSFWKVVYFDFIVQ